MKPLPLVILKPVPLSPENRQALIDASRRIAKLNRMAINAPKPKRRPSA